MAPPITPATCPRRFLLGVGLAASWLLGCEAGRINVIVAAPAAPGDATVPSASDGAGRDPDDLAVATGDLAAMVDASLDLDAPALDLSLPVDATLARDLADPGPPDLAWPVPSVVLNEIHYAPADKTLREEFVELFSLEGRVVDLSGWRLTGGIDFTFPQGASLAPGAYAVIAQDPAALARRYPGVVALGPLASGLGNAGDDVVLRDASGHRVDALSYRRGFPWPVAGGAANGSIERTSPRALSDRGASWRLSRAAPTPGAVNSVLTQNAPPSIDSVEHVPRGPASNASVYVLARIDDPDGVAGVTLEYQVVEPGRYVRLSDAAYAAGWVAQPMVDDGTAGDARAGDGLYTAVIAPSVQQHRRLVRYRVTATDGGNRSVRVPYPEDPQPNFAYYVYDAVPEWTGASRPGVTPPIRFDATVMNRLPVFQLVASESDVLTCQYDARGSGVHYYGTLVVGDQVADHVEYEIRGQYSNYVAGKNKWRIHLKRAHELEIPDNYGRPYRVPWSTIAVSACASPWVPGNRGMAGLDEGFATRLYELAGVPSAHATWFQLRVVDRALEAAPNDQYTSDLWGLYLAQEQPEGAFLDERDLPDGNLYAVVGGVGVKHNQGPSQPTGNADYAAFSTAFHQNQVIGWWRANVDLPAYYAFRSVDRIVNNMDLRDGDNHFQYHRPDDNRWVAIPWDLDMLYMPTTHWAGTIGIENAILQHAELYTEYRNRARELADLLFTGEQLGELVSELASFVSPPGAATTFAQLDEAMWNYHPRTTAAHRGAFYRSPSSDTFRGGTVTRVLTTRDHAGMAQWIKDFTTNGGYGARFLAGEAQDAAIPAQPTLAYAGAPGFPVDGITLRASAFADPQGPNTFAGMQWRLAELTPPASPFDLRTPRKYEVQADWVSAVIAPYAATVTVPAEVLRVGALHRARVRMRDATGRWSRWSAPLEFSPTAPAAPLAPQSALRVTELHYHPEGGAPEEFIELANIGAAPLDLTHVTLGGAVRFALAGSPVTRLQPGERVVVVESREDFRARYGDKGILVAGEYAGRLSDLHEELVVTVGKNLLVQRFTYSHLWQPASDGQGRSLEIVDPRGALPSWDQPASWRASAAYGGTPGR